MITGHVLVSSQSQVNKEKKCTIFPCHASWADIQTAGSRECFSAKGNGNGGGTDKVLRIEKNRSDNYPQKESSDPGEPTG
jgi:hypothetical protein